jgi:acyl carrier protein
MSDNEKIDAKIIKILTDHAKLGINVQQLGVNDDLHQAGMNSLAGVNVMLALEDAFDIEFPNHMLNKQVFSCISSIRAAITELTL